MSSRGLSRVRLVADPYPPYQYPIAGAVEGFDHDLIVAAFAAAGLEAETELIGWSQCFEAVRDGSADALFQITPTAERESWLAFSAPFREARSVLYRRRGGEPALGGDGDLQALAERWRFGALEDFSYSPAVDAVTGKVGFASDRELLGCLRAGEVDVAIVDEGVANYLLGGDAAVEQISGFAVGRQVHVAALREREEVVRAFDFGLAELGVMVGG